MNFSMLLIRSRTSHTIPEWTMLRPITIGTLGEEYTNHPVKISITYDADMNPDFSDLRFKTVLGVELSYWIQESIASTSAIVWVLIPLLSAEEDTTINMYYGNITAESGSNGSAVFPTFFDDFTDWVPEPSAQFLAENDEIEKSINCPSVIKMPNGNLLCGFCSDDSPPNDLHNCIRGCISDDGGETWGAPFIIVDHAADYSYGSAEVSFGLVGNKILLFYLKIVTMLYDAKIHQLESIDNGETWTNDMEIPTGHAYNNICGNNTILLTNGKLILPYSYNNGTYPPWDFRGSCMISEDDGESWSNGGTVPIGTCSPNGQLEPGIVETPDGSLLMFLRTFEGHIWKSTSSDDGMTWATSESTGIVASSSTVRMLRISMDPDVIHIIWNHVPPTTRHPLCIAELTDGGTTIAYEKIITNPAYQVAMGCEIVDGNNLLIIWWDRPDELNNMDNIVYCNTTLDWLRQKWGGHTENTSISGGILTLSGDNKYITSNIKATLPAIIETRAKISSNTVSNVAIGWGDEQDGVYSFPTRGVIYYTNTTLMQLYSRHGAGTWESEKAPFSATLTNYEILKFMITAAKTKVYYDDTLDVESQINTGATVAGIWFESRTNCDVLVNWVLVRPYSADPVITIGAEQEV